MEWKEETNEIKVWRFGKEGIAIEISGAWKVEADNLFTLEIRKELPLAYGKSENNQVIMDRSVVLNLSFEASFKTLDEAKAKAEELLPLFECIG